MKNWKTTIAGLVVIISTTVNLFAPQYSTLWAHVVGIAAGLGLLAAPDAKQSPPAN